MYAVRCAGGGPRRAVGLGRARRAGNSSERGWEN